jgi:hypothetical protein
MQDLGTASGPSNSLTAGGIPLGAWHSVGGGETGFTAPDPTDPNIIYAGEYGGYISRYDERTRHARGIGAYPFNPSGHGAEDLKYRFQWTAPVLISPHDPKVVYHAANVLFQSSDAGLHWTAISPDLTRNDRTKQKWSGGPITGDNTTAEYYCTIFAIAESPRQKGLLWAGSDDGLVHVSQDGGKKWDDVTANIPGMPEWGTVDCIEASPSDAGTAYVVVDAHRLDDMKPYLYRTTDLGKTWKNLAGGLPADIYLHAVRADPKQKGLLYAGTERGVAFSLDDGMTWQPLKLNLPTVAVHDIVVKDNDLVLGTNGRSIWILDDLTPVRLMKQLNTAEAVQLLPVQPAYRYRYAEPVEARPYRGLGQNPPQGALVHYFLGKKPKGEITLEVLDGKGNLVRKFTSKEEKAKQKDNEQEEEDLDEDEDFGRKPKEPHLPTAPGLHRFVWDLRYQGATVIKGAKIDGGQPEVGPLVAPGTYTLKLTSEGKSVTAPVEVKLDPRQFIQPLPGGVTVQALPFQSLLHAGELEAQLQFALKVRDDISRLAGVVNRLRVVRQQLLARNRLLKDDPSAEPLIKQSKELVAKLDDLEGRLHNPKAKVAYDILAQRGGAKLYSQLAWLFEMIKDSDAAPTQGINEVYAEQGQALVKYEEEFKALVGGDLAKLNDLAKKMDVPGVVVPREAAAKKP